MVMVFAVAVVLTISLYIANAVKTNPTVTSTFTAEQISMVTKAETALNMFDYLLVFIMMGTGIMCVISAFMIRTYPIFFVIMFIAQMIMVFVASIVSNIWYQVAQASELVAITNTFSYIPFIFNNLPLIVLVFSAAVAIVSYGSPGPQYAYQ